MKKESYRVKLKNIRRRKIWSINPKSRSHTSSGYKRAYQRREERKNIYNWE
jgi:hypothetical protein